MPTVSAIPDAKAGLLTLLQARQALTGVQVAWGVPELIRPERIILGDVFDWYQEAAAMRASRHPRNESFSLELFIRVERVGPGQQEATERAFVILAEIENAVHDDMTLGGSGVYDAQFDGGELSESPSEDGRARIATLTVRVACKARVT